MRLLFGANSDVHKYMFVFCNCLADQKEIKYIDLVEDRTHNYLRAQKLQKLQA